MLSASLVASALLAFHARGSIAAPADPCAAIAGQKWVAPSAVRACYGAQKVQPDIKSNIIEVVNKTLAFHTSENYQILAPVPFTLDVHENLYTDLARISKQSYASDFDLHVDMSRTLKRLNDGHCVYINYCYDSTYISYLPIPLVVLTDKLGIQSIYIAPEAFKVATAEFPDQIDVWQNALSGNLKGKLESLSGAKVLLINGKDPWQAVNDNAAIAGGYQAFGTRQNAFFSSYQVGSAGWSYILGQFAQTSLPLTDSVTLSVQRNGSLAIDTFTLPYRSRIGSATTPFTDSISFWQNNCLAEDGTNGIDIYANGTSAQRQVERVSPATPFRQAPPIPLSVERKHPVNVALDTQPLTDVVLPPVLTPVSPVNGSSGVSQFYLLDDKVTGVLALGSFSANSFTGLISSMLNGLQTLKSLGATQLVVDVTNNGGGYICAAHWLHRIIAGPKSTTIPQAGLDTTARAGPLARLIVDKIVNENADPDWGLLYNPLGWFWPNGTQFSADFNWLKDPVPKLINGHQDAFSLRLSDGCSAEYGLEPPAQGLFDPKKVVIVSNGRCGSSCSLFSITMSKEEGTKTVVVGGNKLVPQQYCGTVGGQSTDFSTIDTEIKSTKLKTNPLAPPDFKTNSVQGITWRLGYGIWDKNQPEEWQSHPADINLPLTADLVNNPVAIWKQVAKNVF